MTRFLGYDPGGDGNHGVAWIEIDAAGRVIGQRATCTATAAAALEWFMTNGATDAAGIGVDTLTEWCLGASGWRAADRWLRDQYPEARNSVASPNSIYGSMSLGGMAVLHRLRRERPELVVSETHPKVLYFALSKRRYEWRTAAAGMNRWCSETLGCTVSCATDHEWDALMSAWACAQGVLGRWTGDLHSLADSTDDVVRPVGVTRYFWPRGGEASSVR